MRHIGALTGVVGLALVLAGPAVAQFDDYQGTLTCGDGLVANGHWDDPSSTLSWDVTFAGDSGWRYSYTLFVEEHAISHLILETSTNLTSDEITNVQGDFIADDGWTLGTYTTDDGNSNPDMPDSIYGIKFELGGEVTDLSFSFDCRRDPVWGDFYAKNGVGGGEPATLWNEGFEHPEWDPLVPVHDGSEAYHVVRPDTSYKSIPEPDDSPEPATWVLLAMTGVVGIFRLRRREDD